MHGLLRAFPDDLNVRRYAGTFAYGVQRRAWHAHLVIESDRIDQRALNAIAARHGGVEDVQVNLLRLPDEVIYNRRIYRPEDFTCPEARHRLFSITVGHFDYLAAQPLGAPRACTLWIESQPPQGEPAGRWPGFRDRWTRDYRAGLHDLRHDLASIPSRRSAFARSRSKSLRQHGRHRDLMRRDAVSLRIWPGRGRLRYVDLSTIPCPVCALHMA